MLSILRTEHLNNEEVLRNAKEHWTVRLNIDQVLRNAKNTLGRMFEQR